MKVSVLMPIYNTQEKFLRAAIESILNQSYRNFEFLIYDDASTVDLERIVKSYNDNRIIYKRLEKNVGISAIRNILVKDAKGEYLAIMDHDDISLPERLRKQVEYLNNHKNVGVVGTWHGFVHSEEIFKRPILINNNIKYEKDYTPAEDYALWAYLLDKTDFYNIPEVLFLYRNDYENTTNAQNEKIKDEISKVLKYLKQNYPKHYELSLCKKKLNKHLKNLTAPFEYILEPFAVIKYALKLMKLKGELK